MPYLVVAREYQNSELTGLRSRLVTEFEKYILFYLAFEDRSEIPS
jgi:hypothetical protein